MKILDTSTKKLQSDTLDLVSATEIIDACLLHFPSLNYYLDSFSPDFESGDSHLLTAEEEDVKDVKVVEFKSCQIS